MYEKTYLKKHLIKNLIIFIYEKLIILISEINQNDYVYIFFFKFLFFLRTHSSIRINKKNNLFVISDKLSKYKLQWSFPYNFKLRGINSYILGINKRGIEIANSYNINKIVFEDNDIIIDCGSNLNDLLIYLGSLDLKLHYHAIEPGRYEAVANRFNLKNANFPKIQKYFHEIALDDNNEKKTFYYSPKGANSSLLKPSNYDCTYRVKAFTFDYFLEAENLINKKIKLLKLEAEGLEPEILKGASKTLANIEYIAADLGPERGIKEECTLAQVSSIMFDNGFKMINFEFPRITALFKNTKYLKN